VALIGAITLHSGTDTRVIFTTLPYASIIDNRFGPLGPNSVDSSPARSHHSALHRAPLPTQERKTHRHPQSLITITIASDISPQRLSPRRSFLSSNLTYTATLPYTSVGSGHAIPAVTSKMETMRGTSPTKNAANNDCPEQLLDAFKTAALSVTKLYKSSAAAQAKARTDGYQDCLDDLLAFLDKRNIGLSDGEGWQIRRWATERLDGKDAISQTMESEDEVDKPDPSPEIHRSETTSANSGAASRDEPSTSTVMPAEPQPIAVPSQDNFTFQSSHPYPQESYLNIANLDLSDSARTNDNAARNPSTISITRPRLHKRGTRPKTTNLGKGAGQKRPINFAEIFDMGSLGLGKDVFGREGKRSRHT
jgi:hypothetical protein